MGHISRMLEQAHESFPVPRGAGVDLTLRSHLVMPDHVVPIGQDIGVFGPDVFAI